MKVFEIRQVESGLLFAPCTTECVCLPKNAQMDSGKTTTTTCSADADEADMVLFSLTLQ